ncbi:hypothetical protein C8J56DRAFT_386991 [Mycena floridula]|nr:hypothetical protein C8J56DRAFT_386991 [Mycena floridula]
MDRCWTRPGLLVASYFWPIVSSLSMEDSPLRLSDRSLRSLPLRTDPVHNKGARNREAFQALMQVGHIWLDFLTAFLGIPFGQWCRWQCRFPASLEACLEVDCGLSYTARECLDFHCSALLYRAQVVKS